MRRVAITGIGALTAGGIDAERSWQAVRDAHQPFGAPSRLGDKTTGVSRVAELRDYDPETYFDRRRLSALDPAAQYAIVAGREALAQSGIDFADYDPDRTMCVIGSGAAGEATHDMSSERIYRHGADRLHPLTVPRLMASAPASQLAIEFGIRGGVFLIASACASAAHAIGQAYQAIRYGMADIAMTGGTEASLTFGCLKGWEALHVLSDDLCRPFSFGRRGLMLGEGAAILVLEEMEAARRRGADILGELRGFGMSSDAGSLTSPDPAGMARAMRLALADAGADAGAVDHLNAHGTGTNMNDASECQALHQVFGDRATRLPVTATKSVLGHCLGASGAIELVMAVKSLGAQTLAPTANFVEPDPECPIDCVPNVARDARIRTIVSNSFAFGGLNASLVLGHA